MSRKNIKQDAIYNERGSGAIAHGGRFSGSTCLKGHYVYWDPSSEERTPDFRAFGGGGGGALASLRTGSGGAISVEFLWLLLGGGGGGRVAVITPSVCRDGELRVLVALGVSGGGLKGIA